MIALGIDPGLTGAMALVCQRRGFLDVADLPTCPNGLQTGGMKRWLDGVEVQVAYVPAVKLCCECGQNPSTVNTRGGVCHACL